MKNTVSALFLGALLVSQGVLANEKITFSDASLRAPIPGMENTAGYVEITNTSDKDIVLTDANSNIANKVEYHDHIMASGVMKMVKRDKLVIPAGKTVKFQSGGLHLMFIGLTVKAPLSERVTVNLISETGEVFPVELAVKSVKMQHQHHHH